MPLPVPADVVRGGHRSGDVHVIGSRGRAPERPGVAGHRVVAATPCSSAATWPQARWSSATAGEWSQPDEHGIATHVLWVIALRYTSVMSSSLGIRNNFLRFTVKLCKSLRHHVMKIDCIRSLPLGAAAVPEGY